MDRLKTSRFHKPATSWLLVWLLVALVLAWSVYLMYPSFKARYLARELLTLQPGRSTFYDAEGLAEKLNARSDDTCSPAACSWDVEVNNDRIPRWWRGAGEVFVIGFAVKDGIVVRKVTAFGTGLLASFSPSHVSVEEQEHWGRGNTKEPVQAGWYTTEKFRYYWFTVRMTPKASAEDRRRYTAFKYSCFWIYKGCTDARDLLPTAGKLE